MLMPIEKNLTTENFRPMNNRRIHYIVIHYTANNGDTAYNNTKYFKNVNRGASAHYFVDEKSIWQCVDEKNVAWHCGTTGEYKHINCRNENSIGIEMCSRRRKDGEYYFLEKTEEHTVELVRHLMNKYNIPIDRVLRHYDVTGKVCPAPYVLDVSKWDAFKNKCSEVLNVTEYERLRKEINDNKRTIYKRNIDIPVWGKEAVDKALEKNVLRGNGEDLDLSEDVLKTLVILNRLELL